MRISVCRGTLAALCAALCLSSCTTGSGRAASSGNSAGPAERRAALFRAAKQPPAQALPVLAAGLDDPNPVVRRTAVRLLADIGAPARAALERAARSPDPVVRRSALRILWTLFPGNALPWYAAAVRDPDSLVRMMAVQQIVLTRPRPKELTDLLRTVERTEKDRRIRGIASRALWPFHREDRSIRRRSDWDHTVTVLQTIPMPRDGWRFKTDPDRLGHRDDHAWYKPGFDDAKWPTIAIEQAWQKAGYDYIGVAWYRRRVLLPEKPKGVNAVEICFDGVDECAWVWVNGKYVGEHDIGPSGWNVPFTLDITREVIWGKPNLIVVRAMNTAHAGGIWRPVRIEILK